MQQESSKSMPYPSVRPLLAVTILALTLKLGSSFYPFSNQHQPAPMAWDFQQFAVGSLPPGFTTKSGEWSVVEADANRVLEQRARSNDDTFNLVVADEPNLDNVDLSVRLKAVSGELDRGGGLVWRAKDKNNYYIARYNPLENNFRVYKVQDGKRTQFQSADTPGDSAWHLLRVKMAGTRITCYLDGVKYLEVDDATFKAPGRVGLWSKADADTYFDDLKVARY